MIVRSASDRRGGDRRATDRRVDFKAAAEWQGVERRRSDRREAERRALERRCAELPEGLHLLELPQSRSGFRYFISSWFFVDSLGRRILVDPGPAATIPQLISQLSRITQGVDIVLLTHIHLDHSGGLAQFCRTYGGAKVLVHPKGRKHLLDPGKLWKASQETLGEVAAMYGEPLTLPPDCLLDHEELEGVTVLETPGHAPHHLSFIVPMRGERLIFLGEAAGMYLPMASTPTLPYLRPTTPPKFDGAAAQSSLRKIEESLKGDELLCYSHWGAARRPQQMIALAKGQMDEWLALIAGMRDRTEDEIVDYLLLHDSLLSGYFRLPTDLRERERYFIKNSVRGFLGYLQEA